MPLSLEDEGSLLNLGIALLNLGIEWLLLSLEKEATVESAEKSGMRVTKGVRVCFYVMFCKQ